MERIYRVIRVGGRRDGELLGIAITEIEAITMARKLEALYKNGLNQQGGGIGIVDWAGSVIEW